MKAIVQDAYGSEDLLDLRDIDRPVPGDDAALAAVLKDSLARSPEKVVILAGDREVVLGEVVRVLGLAKEAGASGFALASE